MNVTNIATACSPVKSTDRFERDAWPADRRISTDCRLLRAAQQTTPPRAWPAAGQGMYRGPAESRRRSGCSRSTWPISGLGLHAALHQDERRRIDGRHAGRHLERHAPTVIGDNDNLPALAASPPDHLLADPMELEAFRRQPVL